MASIQDLGAIAGILAVILTVILASKKRIKSRSDRRKLEKYLKDAKDVPGSRGRRTTTHLVARLHLTEEEIIAAAASSKHVRSLIIPDRDTGRADDYYYEYKD